jgi:hypothetical protein
MPQSITIAAFVFGAVLLLIAIMGGGFKLFGAEVSGRAGILSRMIAGAMGLSLILVGISGSAERDGHPAQTSATSPATSATSVPTKETTVTESTPSGARSPSPQPPTPEPPRIFAPNPALPPSACPVLQGMVWLQTANTWYGPFAGGDGLSFSSAGGFYVWEPNRLNIYGSYGVVTPYPDPYFQIQRNIWTPLHQSRFSICVDSYGNVFGVQRF